MPDTEDPPRDEAAELAAELPPPNPKSPPPAVEVPLVLPPPTLEPAFDDEPETEEPAALDDAPETLEPAWELEAVEEAAATEEPRTLFGLIERLLALLPEKRKNVTG